MGTTVSWIRVIFIEKQVLRVECRVSSVEWLEHTAHWQLRVFELKSLSGMAIFYDTHAHLDYPDFAADLPEVMARAEAAGISKIVCIGTGLESSQRAIKLAERLPNVFAVVGWHPSYVSEAPEDWRPALRELARH